MQFAGFPLCCGAGIVYNFSETSADAFKRNMAQQISNFNNIGNILAILNHNQFERYDKWLTDTGFQMFAANINNPNHGSKLYFYMFSKPENLKHHKNAEIIPIDTSKDISPEWRALIERTVPVNISDNSKAQAKKQREDIRINFFNVNKDKLTKEEVSEYNKWFQEIQKEREEEAKRIRAAAERQQKEYQERLAAERVRIQEMRRQEEADRIRRAAERAERLKARAQAVPGGGTTNSFITPGMKAAATRAYNTRAARASVNANQRMFVDANGQARNARAYLDPYDYS
jgi:hypothetical protein